MTANESGPEPALPKEYSQKDQTLLTFARLMGGGQEED